MKVKTAIGVNSNTQLYPNYPTVEDVIELLSNEKNIENKKIKDNDWKFYIEDESKVNDIVNELIERKLLTKKTVSNKIYYIFSLDKGV